MTVAPPGSTLYAVHGITTPCPARLPATGRKVVFNMSGYFEFPKGVQLAIGAVVSGLFDTASTWPKPILPQIFKWFGKIELGEVVRSSVEPSRIRWREILFYRPGLDDPVVIVTMIGERVGDPDANRILWHVSRVMYASDWTPSSIPPWQYRSWESFNFTQGVNPGAVEVLEEDDVPI